MNTKKHIKPMMKEPLTLEKLNQVINQKLDIINNELGDGLNFIKDCEKSVTFFGSARTDEKDSDYILARTLASKISKELDYAVVTGGSGGIMEAANRGAYESNGRSIGLNIHLPEEQAGNKYTTKHMSFDYFFTRKVTLAFSAEAYVFLPGGFGTMDELFEILTLIQTNKVEKVPVILVGGKYWKEFDNFVKNTLLKNKKIDLDDPELYKITDDLDEIVEIIRKAPIRTFLN